MYCQQNIKKKHVGNKANKTSKKKPETVYYLECKDYNNYFKQQEVKMKNKVLRENSNCIDCRSNKSRFLKQK